MRHAVIALALVAAATANASDQIGTIVQLDGQVQIFTNPSNTLSQGEKAQGVHALFEHEYFRVRPAKLGDRVEKGNILRTAPGAKARLVFDNGDQFNVASGTAYRVTWKRDTKDTSTRLDLMYGKLRGVVEKGGPRSHMMIHTHSATMGVRGTDFYIADDGMGGGTSVSILRGKVEVTPNAPKSKPIVVKSGYSAQVAPVAASSAQKARTPSEIAKTELFKTTQEDLHEIAQASAIQTPEPKRFQPLEKKAVQVTLKDIKTYQPKLYAQLEQSKVQNAQELNHEVVQRAIPMAPKGSTHVKPSRGDLEQLEHKAYRKYFKEVE